MRDDLERSRSGVRPVGTPLRVDAARGKVARMSLTCNIDARGKAARLRIGIGGLVLGAVLLAAWALPTGTALAWIVTGSVLLGAAFSVFEARAGWCVVRAMGF